MRTKALFEVEYFFNLKEPDRSHRLCMIACEGDIKLLELLIKNGVDVNCTDHSYTPLMGASMHGQVQVVKFLLENGAYTMRRDVNNETALHHSIYHLVGVTKNTKTIIEIIQLFINHGMDIDTPGYEGRTLLFNTTSQCNIELTELLLSWGSNIDHKNNLGITCIDEFKEYKLRYILEFGRKYHRNHEILRAYYILDILCQHKAVKAAEVLIPCLHSLNNSIGVDMGVRIISDYFDTFCSDKSLRYFLTNKNGSTRSSGKKIKTQLKNN